MIVGQYFQGDMVLDLDQMMAVMEQDSKMQGSEYAAIKARHWKDGNGFAIPIPFFIAPNLGKS